MNRLVSIIVPVYNSENSIYACLDSLIAQDYHPIEIVIVNDGSTDNSGDIIKKYTANYPNIVVIDQQNCGVSVARNNGLRQAKGDYVCFVDSDDIVTSDYCSSMVPYLKEADIVVGGRSSYQDGIYIKTKCPSSVFSEKGKDSIKWLLLGKYNAHMVCTKMFRKALFVDNQIQFPSEMIFEDLCVAMDTYLAARTVTYIDKVVYNYLVHSNSAHTTATDYYITSYLKAIAYVCKKIDQNGLETLFLPEIIIKLGKGLDRINRLYVNNDNISTTCFKENVKELLELIQHYRTLQRRRDV